MTRVLEREIPGAPALEPEATTSYTARVRRGGGGVQRAWRAVPGLVLALAAGPTFADELPCQRCHEREAVLHDATGGHAPDLECPACHADRTPGRIGPRHRRIPRCPECHEGPARHPPAAARHASGPTRNCLRCHDAHGSSNAALIRPSLVARGRLTAIDFTMPGPVGPGSFVDPAHRGDGLCEVCHRKTDVYNAHGGDPHFTQPCDACHDHDAGFAPVATEANCAICHVDQATRFTKPSGHMREFTCSHCHPDAGKPPGPHHRVITPCTTCHDNPTHTPPGRDPLACADCHDPHGTDQIDLVRDAITSPDGTSHPIHFDSLLGRVDGGFASASAPGTGVCEVCHTTTKHYRADGTGDPHFKESCLPCHRHSMGFAPQQP